MKILTAIGGISSSLLTLTVWQLTFTAIGGASAYIISLVIGDNLCQMLAAFNLIHAPVSDWQLGAALGFLAGVAAMILPS